MDTVSNMYVVQGRIFAPDIVPYRLVVTPFGTDLLKQKFSFREASWNQENWDYVLQDGTLENNGRIIPVTWLGFNDRRIVIQVLGNSAAAHAVYAALEEALAQLSPSFGESKSLLLNEETSCSAHLDFDWTELLNPVFADLVSRRAEELSTNELRKTLKTASIRFTIGTETTDERLSGYSVLLSDQTLTIEPKAAVPLAERIYFTYSPCDSETHLQLVSDIEQSLTKKRNGPEKKTADAARPAGAHRQ